MCVQVAVQVFATGAPGGGEGEMMGIRGTYQRWLFLFRNFQLCIPV